MWLMLMTYTNESEIDTRGFLWWWSFRGCHGSDFWLWVTLALGGGSLNGETGVNGVLEIGAERVWEWRDAICIHGLNCAHFEANFRWLIDIVSS